MNRIEIGKKIRILRNYQGMSQGKLATLSGQSPSYIPQIENGIKCPTVEVLENICYALGITLADFFGKTTTQIKVDRLSTLSPEQKSLLNNFLNSL